MSKDDQTRIFTAAKPKSSVKGKDSPWKQSEIRQQKLKAQLGFRDEESRRHLFTQFDSCNRNFLSPLMGV